ncbi:MAG: hypothetical protein IPH20_07315 [Bacteroidales bacterium]|nr:hypothetical protein [Bacteroidales bacterium]
MKIVAFKTSKPKQFNYKPLYYDQQKEEMEERLKKYSEPEQSDINRFRSKIRETWRVKEKKNFKLSKMTLYVYLIGSILLIYFIFFR